MSTKTERHASVSVSSAAVRGVTVVTTSTLAAVATDDTSLTERESTRATAASKSVRLNASMLVAIVVEKRRVG